MWAKQKLEDTLQFTNYEMIKECNPKRLSWAAYNDLERKKRERVLQQGLWMLP
jgi:hypothetical protein